MQKAIFLDRDGVINNPREKYYIFKKEDFFFNPSVFKRLREYSQNGYLIIIISNQGGISNKFFLKSDTENLHKHIIDEFKKENIGITEIYYCPHHSDNEKCICRKPDSLLIEKAIARFDIDKSKSILIGDSERDILSGEKAGIKSLLIKKNSDLPSLSDLL